MIRTDMDDISDEEFFNAVSLCEEMVTNYVKDNGIYENTSINTLQNMKSEDYPIFSELYEFLSEYKKNVKSKEKEKILEQLDIII